MATEELNKPVSFPKWAEALAAAASRAAGAGPSNPPPGGTS